LSSNIQKNIDKLVSHLTKFTVRLVTLSEGGAITGQSSAFLYQPIENKIPFIITAGHNLPTEGSFLETRVIKDGSPVLINGGLFKVFYNHGDIDYAYSELPVKLLAKDMQEYKGIEFNTYQHDFQIAKKGEAYSFAVINNYEFVKSGEKIFLPTYCCYEIGLELVDQDEHINYFKPTEFKGHDYYKGASGAPITDPEGVITSILIGGDDRNEFLRAFRLDNIEII
jgi:hypothetical protein